MTKWKGNEVHLNEEIGQMQFLAATDITEGLIKQAVQNILLARIARELETVGAELVGRM